MVISHAKLQINVWMFVSGWKWQSGIKDGSLPSPAVLWIDSVYEKERWCQKYLMKEYTHCIHSEEVIFTNVLRSCRNQIECVLGKLKERWSILTKQFDLKLGSISYMVYSCFVLYNFCELSNVEYTNRWRASSSSYKRNSQWW